MDPRILDASSPVVFALWSASAGASIANVIGSSPPTERVRANGSGHDRKH
jgi:hypothetical protein